MKVSYDTINGERKRAYIIMKPHRHRPRDAERGAMELFSNDS